MESKTLPRRSTTELLPPPPQYKGVHFAPSIVDERRPVLEIRRKSEEIPSEGLPLGPAIPKAETVAIQVRNNPVPLLSSVKPSASNSASNTSSFEPKVKNKAVLGEFLS